MNVVIVGRGKKLDFLIEALLKKKNKITIINDVESECKEIARRHDVQTVHGDGSKPFILADAGIGDAHLIIALTLADANNLVICQLAKKMFGVKRAFATVNNPKNVDIFHKLGVDTAVSATRFMAEMIEQMASVSEIVNYLPMENGAIQLMELMIKTGHPGCDKQLLHLSFPKNAIIGAIMRKNTAIIPNGNTQIEAGDKLIILVTKESRKHVLKALTGDPS